MSIFTFVEGGYNNRFRDAMLIEAAYFPIRLLVVYTNYFILMPRLLLNGATIRYILMTLTTIIIGALLQRWFAFYHINELIFPGWEQGEFWQLYRIVQTGMIITSPMIFLIGITVVYRLVESQRKLAEIAEERTKAELQYLKNQINPHFFFNTLNNLYGLALAKSDKTSEVVMKLSELMSYMLYDTRQSTVPLTKELNYIQNYIELEEIRFEGRFSCNVGMEGDVESVNLPPMLLLPFVENAFKHGVNTASRDAWINVIVKADRDRLSFVVENSVGEKKAETKGGLGIENVKRRLELLYPQKHTLEYGKTEEGYKITLELNL